MILLALFLGCGGGDTKALADSGEPSGSTDTAGFCDSSPVITWNNFGNGFVTENCNACHAADAPYRQTASADVVPPQSATFDTEAQVMAAKDAILAFATGEDPLMPPEGGVPLLDRERLEIWLTCVEDE